MWWWWVVGGDRWWWLVGGILDMGLMSTTWTLSSASEHLGPTPFCAHSCRVQPLFSAHAWYLYLADMLGTYIWRPAWYIQMLIGACGPMARPRRHSAAIHGIFA